jgi:hypothetical protein
MDHKDLFPLDGYDYLGTVLIGVGLMIAAAGGVGGGGHHRLRVSSQAGHSTQ